MAENTPKRKSILDKYTSSSKDTELLLRRLTASAAEVEAQHAAREEEYRKANAPKTREQLQGIIDTQTAKIDSIRNANKDKWDKERAQTMSAFGGSMFAPASQNYVAATSKEQKQLEAAQLELKNARKALDTYTESDQKRDIAAGKEKSWLGEAWDGLTNTNINELADIATFDMHSAGNKAKINRVMEKKSKGEEVSEIEQTMIDALSTTRQSEQYVAENGGGTAWNSIGDGVRQSAGFMIRTGLSGGSLGITRELVSKGAWKAAATMLGREALRSPIYTMASDFQNRTADQYSIGTDGSVEIDNVTSLAERLWKSYATSAVEGISEQIGSFIPGGFVGKGLRKVAPKLLGAKIGGAVEKGVDYAAKKTKGLRDTFQKVTNYNGTIDEYLEEQFNNIVEPILTGETERIKDNFSAKQQWITLGSVAVMGGAMHSVSLPSIARDEIRSGNLRKQRNQSISAIENEAMRQGVFDAVKKGVTVEDRAKMMASLDWAGASQTDAANAVDAYTRTTRLDLLRGFDEAQRTQELTAQKVATHNDTFLQNKHEQTGMLHEVADNDGNGYFLLSGSLDEQTPDGTVFVRNMITGKTEQKASTLLSPISTPTTYEDGLMKSIKAISQQTEAEINEREAIETEEDAAQSSVAPLSYQQGDNVQLADGRVVYFLSHAQDGTGMSQVVVLDDETGEQETIEIPRGQIMGLASQDDAGGQKQPEIGGPDLQSTETAEVSDVSQSPPREIPLRKDGQPDYDAMPVDMFFNEYSKVASREEALADLQDIHDDLQKSINRIKSSKVTSLNKKADNRAKLAQMQNKIDEINAVIQYNTPDVAEQPATDAAIEANQKTEKLGALRQQMIDLGDYVSLEDVILRDIASGAKFLWSDDGVKRGLASELGFNKKQGEMQKRISLLRKDGYTLKGYAESVMSRIGPDVPHFPGIDEDMVMDTASEILTTIHSPSQAAKRAHELHEDTFDEDRVNYIEGQKHSATKEQDDNLPDFDSFVSADQGGYLDLSDDSHSGIDAITEPVLSGDSQASDAIASAQTIEQKHEAVSQYVSELNKLSGADAVVFSKLEQLPEDIAFELENQWRSMPDQETPGVTFGIEVYIYAPHIRNKADLETVFNHEVAAHRNILLALGQDKRAEAKLYAAVVDGIGVPKMLQLVDDSIFTELANDYFSNPTLTDKLILGKEFAGYMTEKYFDKKEYTTPGKGSLSLNLSDAIQVEDLINILKTANNQGNEQRILIESSSDRNGRLAYAKGDTRNMGQDRTGHRADPTGGETSIELASKGAASGVSGIQENSTYPKDGAGSLAESEPTSEGEIRGSDQRADGGTEQTDRPADAQRDLDNNRNNPDNDLRLQQIILPNMREGSVLESTNGRGDENIQVSPDQTINPIEGHERRGMGGGKRGYERDRSEISMPRANTVGTPDAGLIEGEGERSLEGQASATQGIAREGDVLVESPEDTRDNALTQTQDGNEATGHSDRGLPNTDGAVIPDVASRKRMGATSGSIPIGESQGVSERESGSTVRSEGAGDLSDGSRSDGGRDDGSSNSMPVDGGRGIRLGQPRDGGSSRRYETSHKRNERNFRIDDTSAELVPKGEIAKIKANIEAIRLLKRLQTSSMEATKEDKAILSKYSGWGGLSTVLDRNRALESAWEVKYKKYHDTLRELLSPEEFTAAVNSTINAHYTTPEIISSIWKAVERLGFNGGTVLEPAIGTGNFFGVMPQGISDVSKLVGYELDTITGGIAQLLYPDANIKVAGYETSNERNGSIDLVISNVPFGKTAPYDPKNKDISSFSLHNYFIAKGLRQLKDGGLGVFVTSSSTMDGRSSSAFRRWSETDGAADFLGAIRLPNTAFESNAGTTVTTDILFYRKRNGLTVSDNKQQYENLTTIREAAHGTKWNNKTRQHEDVIIPLKINEYFAQNPQMMLGEMKFAFEIGKGGLYSDTDQTLQANKDTNLSSDLARAIDQLPQNIYGTQSDIEQLNVIQANQGDVVSTYVKRDGKSYEVGDDGLIPVSGNVTIKGKKVEKSDIISAFVDIKELAKELVRMEQTAFDDAPVEKLRKQLNDAYDSFSKKYGTLNKNTTIDFLQDDIQHMIPYSLENINTRYEKSKNGRDVKKYDITKADILRRRINHPTQLPTHVESADEAMRLSIRHRGGVDMEFVAQMLNTDIETAETELLDQGIALINPVSGKIESRSEYLSGYVKDKLAIAKQYAANDPRFENNVRELEKVIPKDIAPSDVNFRFGSYWIPSQYIEQFYKEQFGVRATVNYIETLGEWVVDNGWSSKDGTTRGYQNSDLATKQLNQRQVVVYDKIGERNVKNIEATAEVAAKMSEINDAFIEYIQGREDALLDIAQIFNTKFNNYVGRVYETDSGIFPGANPQIKLRPHQSNAVQRILNDSVLLAHEVGTGKTFTMITGAMEMRRLGIARKPMIVVQNSTLEQFAASFQQLYASAKLLVPSGKQRSANGRQRLFTMIAYGDFDAVIIPQSFIDFIEDDPKRVESKLQKELDAINDIHDSATDYSMRKELNKQKKRLELEIEKSSNPKVKDIARKQLSTEKKFKQKADRRTDKTFTFEELGVDALFVDEAHAYKKLGFNTNMGNVKGIDTGVSKRAFSMKMKTDWIQERTGGRNVVFATGTPITNTMAEAWTMMRFVSPDVLRRYGIENFDAFASTFGIVETSFEFNAAGNFKQVERFKSFMNAPEFIKLFKSKTDVVLSRDIPGFAQQLPKLKDGAFTNVIVKRSRQLIELMDMIKQEVTQWAKQPVKERNPAVPLVMFTRASQAAIDLRLVDPNAVDDPMSKANAVVGNVKRIYDETTSYNGTQMIFVDRYQSPDYVTISDNYSIYKNPQTSKRFNLYEDMKDKLVAMGVPESEIAIVTEMDAKRKEQLFDKMNNGDVRIVIGSTERMGVGVNAQRLMAAVHHVDAPARPMDFTQRNGRIIRQGNTHAQMKKDVQVLTYGVEKTLDVTAYQRLAFKQAFIEQILRGDIDSRIIEDAADEGSLSGQSFEEMMGSLSGSQYAMRLTDIKAQLRKAEMGSKNYERSRSELRMQIHSLSSRVAPLQMAIEKKQNAANVAQKLFPQGKVNNINIAGVKHTEKMGDALNKLFDEFAKKYIQNRNTEALRIGINDNPTPAIVLYDPHNERYSYIMRIGEDEIKGECTTGSGLLTSVASRIKNLYADAAHIEGELRDVQNALPSFEKRLNEPNKSADKVEALKAEIDAVTELIANESKAEEDRIAKELQDEAHKDTDVRFRQTQQDEELERIKSEALANGEFMKAPNGEPTKLTERQWLQVRTSAFKEWFGDWEKVARIEKLRNAESVSITGKEIESSEDIKQYRHNALVYGKTIKGEYENKDTGLNIIVSNTGLDKLLSHDKQSIHHIQSIAAIPALIESSIFISEIQPEKDNPKFDSYKYFVGGLKINGEDYTVKIVVGEKNGDRYYDHALTEIEKGELLSKIDALSIAFNADNSPNTRKLHEASPVSEFKDKRLISILQTNASERKAARIEKLRASVPVEITGKEIESSEDIKEYRRNALEYGKTLRGTYVNKDTGETISLSGGSKSGGLREILHHDYKDVEHLQSIAAIPQIIENAVFIEEIANEDTVKHQKISKYRYYVAGLKISDVDYIVKAVVTIDPNGRSYYDHALTQIEKSDLISQLGISMPINESQIAQYDKKGALLLGLPVIQKTGANVNTPNSVKDITLSEFKDKRLISILQTNASKVVDANGEPKVVYNGVDAVFALSSDNLTYENSLQVEQDDAEIRYDEIRAIDNAIREIETQQTYEKNKTTRYINREKVSKEAKEQLQKLSQKFNTPVVVVGSKRELPENLRYASRDRQFSGLYHKQTGKVYFILNEIRDADDATATFLHEVVAHKGIDGLMGEANAAKFYEAVFNSLPKKEQDSMRAMTGGNKVIAGDEFVAQMAEGNVTPGMKQRVISAVRRFFREVLGWPLTISDNDIRYILWKSRNNLERAGSVSEVFAHLSADKAVRGNIYGKERSLMGDIKDIASEPRVRKGLDWLSSAQKNGQEIDDQDLISATKIIANFQNSNTQDVRYRSASKKEKPVATEHRLSGLKNSIKSAAVKGQEVIQDNTIKVHLLQKEVEKLGGRINPDTNVYESLNHADSRTKAETDKYDREFIAPFIDHLAKLDKKGVKYAEVVDYMSAKHSIERHLSGINALNEAENGNWTMDVTTKIVEDFESKLSQEELTHFWDTWRKATNKILDIAERSGRLSLAQKNKILANGWEYYVPLRGKDWDFEGLMNLQDVFHYDYTGTYRGKQPGKKVVNIRAKGRTTKAEDPIAMLLNMAHTEIYQSQNNIVYRKLLRLAQQYPEMTSLFQIKNQWFARAGENEWTLLKEPPSKKMIDASKEAMKAKRLAEAALKKATTEAERAKISKQIEDADRAIVVKQEVPHEGYTGAPQGASEVVVMKDGKRMVVILKDPEVAQAINQKSDDIQRALSNTFGQATRFMSKMATSKNVAFMIPNFIRDIQHAAMYSFVDSDGDMGAFLKYAATSGGAISRYSKGKAAPLTYEQMGSLNILDTTDRKRLIAKYGKKRVNDTLYELFAINGGETGYVHILDPKDYRRKLRKAAKRSASSLTAVNALPKGFEKMNDGIDYMANLSENITRFAAFMSQIDNGVAVFDAVTYAKNITVNFNRKGKYSKGIGSLFMFFNAGVQGAVNTYSLWGNKKGKSAKEMAWQRVRLGGSLALLAATGFWMQAALHAIISAMIGDDDEELTVSDYERRTNIIIPTGGGTYIKIPIPILFRPWYSLGVKVHDWMVGREEGGSVAARFAGEVADAMLPFQVDVSIDPEKDGLQAYKAFIPSPIKPLAELGYNSNFAGRPINKDSKYAPSGTPDSQMGMPYASSWAKWISKTLNAIGGGNKFTAAGVDENGYAGISNLLDISPSSIEHLATSYTGGVGKLINDTYKLLLSEGGDRIKIPVADRFYGKAYEKDPSREYYDLRRGIELVHRNNKQTKEHGVESAWYSPEELEGKTIEYENYYKKLRHTEKRIRNIRERMKEVEFGSTDYESLDNQINRLQRQFIKQYDDQRN